MDKNNTYALFPAEIEFDTGDKINCFDGWNKSKRKKGKKKKGKKAKMKKYEKTLAKLLDNEKGKKKSKGKAKKQSKKDLQYRLIEKSTDTFLDTASDIARMYAESKFFPSGRSK